MPFDPTAAAAVSQPPTASPTAVMVKAAHLGCRFMHNPAVPARPVTDDDTGPLSPTVAHRLTAVVQLPFQQQEQATAALRGELRYQLTERLNVPAGKPQQVMDFDTLTVDGPTLQTDPGGRAWFTYTGTATSRLLRPIDPAGPGQS